MAIISPPRHLHFAHANGYPPGAYQALLDLLSQEYSLTASPARPLWPGSNPTELRDWRPLATDLIRFLRLQEDPLGSVMTPSNPKSPWSGESPFYGVGHSMGGTTTLLAALHDPSLFSALVLIDPVIFPPWMSYLWKIIYASGFVYRLHPLARGALKRRTVFDSKTVMFANYRSKPVFSKLDDAALQAYVNAIGRENDDGKYELTYSPAWEARIYVTSVLADLEIWKCLPSLKIPLLVLRGAVTDTFWESTARMLQKRIPHARVETIDGAGHLLPLEKPIETAQRTCAFLSENI